MSASDVRDRLQGWMATLDSAWDERWLGVQARKLPPAGDPLRRPALVELVKLDLGRHWQAGRRVRVESYLKAVPELGTPRDVPIDLVRIEIECCRRHGVAVDPDQLLRRFPEREAEIRPLFAQDTLSAPEGAFGATQAPPAEATELQEQFGRYRIQRKLGQGGMGAVYLAHDTQLDRRVALKVPHLGSDDPRVLKRFLQEARAAATVEHPNICPIYDVGEVNGRHYVTLAYIEGRPLSTLIRGDAHLPQDQVADLVRKLALALDEAHKKGVIHRDLKPANIMVNQRREPIVMDFGLARRTAAGEERLTRDGTILGTPAYMPPEQVNGDLATMGPASDVYSLGVVLYELLTGRLPFEGPITAVLGRILTQEPPRPSTHRPDLDPALETVCLKAIAKKPEDRFGSMGEFAAALAGCLQGAATVRESGVPAPTSTSGAAEPTGPATQLLARLLERLEETTVDAKAKPQGRRRTLVLAVAAGVLLVAVAVLVGMLLSRKDEPTAVTVTVRLEGLPEVEARMIVLLDGDEIDAETLAGFLVLRPGEHELIVRHDDGQIVERRRFRVADDDDRRTIELPPPEQEEPRVRVPVVLPAGRGPFRKTTSGAIDDLAFSPDGTRLAAACRDGVIVVWDTATRKEERSLRHPGPVDCLTFSPDGKELIAGDAQKQIVVWKLADGSKRLVLTHPERVRAVAISPDGRWLFGGAGTMRFWNLSEGKELFSFRDRDWSLRDPVFSPDGGIIAGLGHNAPGIKLWDVRRRKTATTLRVAKGVPISLAFSPDGKTLAAGGTDGKVNLWSHARQQVRTTLPAAPGPVLRLQFQPDGRTLIGVCRSKVVLWDVETEKIVPTTDPPTPLGVSIPAPDGRTLAYVSAAKGQGGEVHLLDVDSLRVRGP